MKILFIHQNFPGQYLHLVRYLSADPSHELVAITQRKDVVMPGVRTLFYQPQRPITKDVHHYLQDAEGHVLNAQMVARISLDLKTSGFTPGVMLGHNGWGEIWYLKDVYPNVTLIGYFEFFYRFSGADVEFDPNESKIFDTAPRIRTKNIGNLIALDMADLGQTPTQWQKSVYPVVYQPKLHVVHEGIDSHIVAPDNHARLQIPALGIDFTHQDEVITYVARNLEPYRGFPSFIRSLPAILTRRPQAQVLIVGGDEPSYGHQLPKGQTHKLQMLQELGTLLDLSRVYFLGKVPYAAYLKILQISTVHVYLTYPFVLSWSMLEAMSAGCLIVGSRTQPVQEVIQDGENGLLVDFFSPDEIAERVVDVLTAGRKGHTKIRQNARQTIIDHYDLKTICLPAHLELLEKALG